MGYLIAVITIEVLECFGLLECRKSTGDHEETRQNDPGE